ncbi:MAG: S-layer homology domain-containing protein [Clostridiales bacterium]|nr:S-layer homology domain-containing protein [Clostridiales bacterium]
MFKKMFFAIVLVAAMLVMGTTAAFAASRNYSDWFDLDRINAVDVDEDLTDEANREEVALLIAELCDELGLLPSSRVMDFDDDNDFMSSSSYKMITRLSSTGIVNGYPDGEFKPENEITRAEALTMVLRTVDYFALETENYRRGSSFTDTEGHWAEVYCDRAYEQGLVSGRGNGRFYPDDEITREEIITILVNLMGESNNPLIAAIDTIYDLEFDNSYNDDDDDYYNSRYDDDRYNDRYNNRYDDDDDYYGRYDDDDYEERTERPVVDTGDYSPSSSNSNNSSYNNSNNSRPERPTVNLTTNNDDDDTTTSNGSRPSRPVVDTTSDEEVPTSRPSVDVDNDTASSSRPSRPTV